MSAAELALTLRYVVGDGWYIIAENGATEREVGGPFGGIEQAIDERLKLAEAFDHGTAVAS